MNGIAYAMGQGAASAGGQQGGYMTFVPLILMFVIFYFLLIRPQQKKAKEHREMVANLKKGDRVMTSGGLYGRVTGLDDQTLTLEIAEKVRVKLNRSNVGAMLPSGNASTGKDKETGKAGAEKASS